MKILDLHIQKFRGIVDLKLNLNGENAVIFGPNGVGKSAVVDAVDFLLCGEVSRLTGEGTADVSTAKHGPHIGNPPDEAKIIATIQSINGKVFTVERTVAQKDNVTVDPAYSAEFNEMVNYARSGAHCLARRELLHYILTTPATRSQQIQMLLDIADTKIIRDAFTKLKKTAAGNLKDTIDSLKRHSSDLRTKVGANSDDQLLGSINSLRVVLGGGALASLEESSFTNGLLYSDTKENSEIASYIRSLEELEKYIPTLQPTLKEKLQNVQDIVQKIEDENTSIENISYLTLIKSGIALLDGKMHIDDEKDFSAILNNNGAAVNLSVDFYGQGQFPPMAFHSEGHQDSMGIALFFALMEKLTTSESGLVVLDDVVMSVDIEHRKNFCKLLKTFFPERQFIITTHDTVWAKNLVNEGVVDRKNSIEFLYWNVTEGPITVVGKNVWDTSRIKATTDLHGASAFLRREMECFFENICDKLHARIRYNNVHKWDYGQYMNAAYKELQDLIKKAEQQARVFNNTEVINQLSSLSNTLKAQIATVSAENWVTNVLIHYNPSYEISKAEFLAAVDALEQFCQSFECSKCNTTISATYSGENAVALMCKCGSYAYPLKQ
jgi:recombinational DNA repair ATPase RecF